MISRNVKRLKEYYEKQIRNFDETTLIAPNKNGKKEHGITRKVTHEIPNNTTVFCENNEIKENELFLASLLLALDKFNFSCENLIFYNKNIPFSAKYENRSITIKEYINSIQKTLKENQNHPYESINELLNEYNLKPEFYYSYNENIPSNTDYTNYLNITHTDEKIILSFLFNNQLYTKEYIETFLESVEKIIKQIITGEIDKISISDIAIENENENITFNEIQNPVLHKRFEKQVNENPNKIALVASDKTLTYNELNEKSNRIANALIKRGVEAGNNILIMLKRDSNLIASIIGILKAGCAFIPIDLEYPQERIDYIYENSQADYIISNASEGNSIDVNELLKEEDTSNPNVTVNPEDNAYMIYTSGSTGLPKGVVIGHKNACNEAEGNPKCEYDSILSIATIAFDTSLEDILTGITNGIKIIFANDNEIKNIIDLVQLIKENKPEVMEFTPSRLLSYLEVKEFCKAIDCAKCIVMGGEQFSAKAFNEVKQYTNAKVYNSYGPTETTIASSYKEITDPENITIGKALQNYLTEVRDIDGKLLPQGVMGELYIGGTGVGKGYYNMPEKTEEVFLEINNIPYYRSGDYAIETPNGEIDIKGRIDNQIKLRGLRIEIGEIEANIGKYPHIKQNVVVIKQINNNDHLCAYFTAEQQINTEDLKEFLKERLTRYMVPTVFMQIDEIPQTPNGKTYLKQLPQPELKLSYTLPETETEQRLFDIASSICETTEFGINDDLYSLGFSSLTLMKFNARIYEKIGANLNITAILNEPTIKNIAKQIDNTQTDSLNLKKLVESSKDRVYYPLTSNQLGVYYECIQSSEEAHYNLPSIIRFDSDIDAEKLKASIIRTIEAYPYLKTRIINKNGELMQKRDDSIAIDEIPIIEIDEISTEEIEKENVKTFTLENSQLFRFKIYKTPSETVLFSDFHHLITDGESLDKFFKNIANAYQDKEIEKENIDGYLNSLIEKEYESSEEYEKSRTYFQNRLTQNVESTILTPDLNGNEEEGKLKSISKNINPEQIKQFCSEKGISPNVLIMASTILNLNKYTFSDKTLITTIFNGRTNSNYFNTQTFLVKTLPIISIDENRSLTIKTFLKNIDKIWKETINHSNYPYTKIAEEFQLKPEFFYSYNNLDDETLEINNKNFRVNYLDTIETNYKLTFDVNETENNLEFLIKYNDQLYSEDYVEVFMDCILNILNQFISEDIKKLRIKDIELNNSQVIPTLTPLDIPILHERFEKQVKEKPNEIALFASDKNLTYNELNEKSNRIANALIKRGVEAGNNILVMLKRDSNLIASIIGILKAGCAFIPIDLEYPQERIDYIYENSQADYIISNTNENNSIDVNELLKEENAENPNINVNPNDTAYMIYTSGSTGKPKGVMISHENISNQVQNPKSQYESLLCLATISFDVSVDDILTSLSNGRKLILANDSQIKNIPELIDLINETKPEVSEITPSRLASYLEVEEFCEAIKCIKCLFLGGEQFSAKVYEDLRKYSDAIVYNSYGPTETTITSNNKEITDINNITVGKPLENYVTDIRDIDGKLLPQGVMGELYIGGTGVGKGYYNMPEKTEEVFLEINNIPYYKSGDYAIETSNGEIEIKGRIDDQIKLRGLRIEIGEIETNIGKYPNIKQNVVVIKQINNNDHLCAYFTAEQQINTDDLKDFLKDKLTKYMIPTVFMQIDEMPQTPNGKTDLKKLPKPILKLENVKPKNETEEKLFKIISELIGTDKFGTTDDLYTIGYTSLTLMKLNSLIYEKMNVNLDISVLFNAPTIKKLSEEINANDNEDTYIDELIEMAGKLEYFPLTENQLGIYYECIQSPNEIKYTMPTTIRFGKEIDVEKLKESLIKVIESHPYLKTRIITIEDGTLKQHRNDSIKPDEIEIVKTSHISDEEIMQSDVKAFSLNNEQLFRFKIYDTDDEIVLFSDFHHIITDGVSQGNLFDDLAKAYENKELTTEIVNGYAYSLIENNLENSDKYESAKKFFQEKLSHEIDSTVLTPNLNGNPDDGKIKRVIMNIDSNNIRQFCKENSISQNALFMAATILNLNKYTFSDETLITTIFNGRANPNYYNTQGFLVKTLPFVMKNENRHQSIREFIENVDTVWKETINNSEYPYTKIAEEYQLKPEFFYSYQEFLESDYITIDNKSYKETELIDDSFVATEYKTDLTIFNFEDTIGLQVEYNNQLYTRDYIETFLNSFHEIIIQILENNINDMRICDVELETSKELPKFVPIELPLIHKRFEKQAEKNPQNIALIARNRAYTYSELNEKSNRIANALIKKGIKPGNNILVMLKRDSNLIAAIIGILKAGCTFIPIDLEYPQERIDYIYENSQADYIISNETTETTLDVYELIKEEKTTNPNVEITPDHAAYMIYTSGSTGKPKGVIISHENACNEVEGNPKCEYNSILSIATIAFDTSLEDILTGITNGIKIIFANDNEIKNIIDLVHLIKQNRPEVMEFTPSRLLSYLEVKEFCKAIDCAKCIVMGGEQFSAKAFTGVKQYTDAKVYNSYGPTETTIASSYKEIKDPENITIGKALQNYITEVRDIDGKLLPQGVMGELYIGGTGVGKGYYNMPEKTKEVFLEINNIPYYRSGDYAIETTDGEIDIKGRIDNQIKLRGLRIEVGEIETNIGKYPNIKQNVVVIKQINNNDHLCAYFTAEQQINTDDLKKFLKDKLTNYMIPTVFMQIDEIPQTPNGKTDLKKLPKPILKLENVKSENETEEKLFEIASQLINTNEFGVTDDLYKIGYTSLTLMKLNSQIYNEFNVNIDISLLFNNPTIRKISSEISLGNTDNSYLDNLIEKAKTIEYFPLTENQLGIYYECVQNPDEIKYTMPTTIRFGKEIDVDKLKESLIKVIESHPYIKTRIITSEDGTLKQQRNDNIKPNEIEIVKTSHISDQEIMQSDVKAFSLNNKQLFRFKIYDTDDEIVLFSDFHHIITDGVSQGNLFDDLAKAYENKELTTEIVNGYIYSLIENNLENSEKYESAKKFFQEKLNQGIDSTVLTPNLNGNPDDGKIKQVMIKIDSNNIKKFCKENSISQNALFMATTILNLNKYTFSDETLITTIFNGRANPNYYNTQGFLVKTLPFVMKNENRQQSIREFIENVDTVWKETINNSEYPYTKIAEEYQLKPEFFYSYQEFIESENITINNKTYKETELIDDSFVATEYKTDLTISNFEDTIELQVEYNDQLYTKDYIETFLNSLNEIIKQFLENNINDMRICDVELETSKELPKFVPLQLPLIHKRFEKQAEKTPQNIALIARNRTFTYSELNEKSNRIANALIKKGIEPGSNILVMLKRDSNLIAAIIGILKAGCTFIPIDLEYPQDRIDYIYENSQADYIISNETTETTLNVSELIKEEKTTNPNVEITPDHAAYMIYTSGSTGKPKGVIISHENACNEAEGNPKCEYNSILSIATIAFDTSLEDILTGITNGIKIIFADDNEIKNIVDLVQLIKQNRPEVIEFTPSRLLSYLEVKEFCKAIDCAKCIVMGGEQFSAKAFNEVKQYTNAKVYNSYGPTETTIASSYKEITDTENITIGKALQNYITEVRDIDSKLLPQGVMGELYIGGTGVGKGYYNMPEKTEEVFLEINNIPYYKSGDYAIETTDGEIDIKGRIDNQIKLRGLRIEIGEIETNIGKYPNIKQNIVVIKEINNNDHLCAYFTADQQINTDDLKDFLKDKLTKYMIPTVFMQIDEIPQTPNGKTDLKKLPKPILKLENVKPENETEEKLFEIASQLINTNEFGVTDDLYKIGYTSLTLMKLNTLIYKELDINLDISVLFNNPTIKKLANEVLNSGDKQASIDKFIESSKEMEYYPLTENQLGVYYECKQNPNDIMYVIPMLTRFNEDIDADKLKTAITKTIDYHPYLKTRIIRDSDGEIKLKRLDEVLIEDIKIVEVENIDEDQIIENDIKAFKLDNDQLFHFKIYKSENEVVLFSNFHHIITDGESQENLFKEIVDTYEGKELEEEKVNGYVLSLIEKNYEESEKYETSKKFFHDKLMQDIESTILTPNLSGNPDDGKSQELNRDLDFKSIKKFCKENSISQNVLIMASAIIGLNKFTFSDKALITTIFNGRADPNYYNTQGFLVKTLPLIVTAENREIPIKEFLKQIDETWKDTINNSYYPYTKIAEEFQLKPEFFYAYHESSESEIESNSLNYYCKELDHEDVKVTEYKTNLNAVDDGEKIELSLEYNDQLYTEEYAEKFLDSILHILTQIITSDMNEFRLCDIELENPKEIPEFEPMEIPFIHKRFEKQANEHPNNTAVISSGKSISYGELDQKANRVANALIKKGVEPGNKVLVILPRDINLIAAIMGILKAGCAYIPIDREYPLDRIKYIFENSQADYMITDGSDGNSLDISRLIEEDDMSTPDVDISPDDLAYMIYTSGSTGNPKGVMISHRNIANLFAESDDNIIYEAYTKMHKTLAITTISFDTFLLDLNALTFGLEIVLANDIEMKNIEDLTRLIHKEKPDALTFTTPSRLMQYLDYDKFTEELSTFKYLAVGGEILPKELVSKVVANSEAEIFNIYGPTETTVTCNSISIRDPEKISVGKALHNYVTDVRDIDGKLLPQGVMGELYIGGVGVGKGYYNLEEKTKEVFIEINGIPYYRSGDYAIELPNGEIDIKGRIDNQIKLRGLRIEIGEIESNISRFPHVKQNVVLIKKINDTEHLCAYITADEKLDINLLRRYLENKLTKYMIPSVFMQIDEMPQTPNGKTDIKQLPEPELSLNHDQPETETEKKLFELVKSVSTTEEFGVSDDLYTLGFTSLTLMKLNSLIYKNMNVNLDMASLFNDPSVRNLADSIDNYMTTSIDLDEIMEKAKNMEYFPLTDNQLGIYYECIQELSEIKYTMPTAIRFDSNIDPYKLKDAIIIAIEAHPYLKTRIINTENGELKQKRCDDKEIENIEIVELDVDITPEEIMKNDVKTIPINNHQLFRFKIYKCPNNTWLFSDFHHIITDGVSQDNIFNDIIKAYESGHVKSEKIDGYVYSLIEQENYENEVSEKYFKNKLGDGIESTVLTTNLNGNPDEGEIKLVEDSIDSTFIRHFCNDHSISPNVLFLTATILNLNKFNYSDKTLITTIFNGRANSDFYDTQGMLVKTIPIIINSENREMFLEDFIKIVDKSWKNSMIHSNYPYTKISQTYQLKPEFFYAYHESFKQDQKDMPNIQYEEIPLDGTVATDYKINFNIYNDGETISLYLEYNDQLYTQEYIEKFMYCFKYTLIQFIVNDLDKFRLCDLELENDLGLHEFEQVKVPFIHKRFEKQADKKPDSIALIASDRTLTYKELDNRSNRIANALIKKGIKAKSKILIMLPRTSNLISAIFGVLKSGCAYIPIDLEYPEERIRYIYENSEADYIIAQETSENSLGIDDLLKESNDERPDINISPDDLAYLIYTSGSTGKPKGVMTSHKNIANLFAESDDNIVYDAYSKMHKTLAISTVSFDAFLLDLNALTFGSEVVLANDNEIKSIEELTRLIQKEKPESLTFATPSRLLQYLDYDQFAKELASFKYIGVGGEMVPKELVSKVFDISEAEIFNIYGPTETTVTCNSTFIRNPEEINVGKALHNYVTEVRDIDGKLLPQGVMGELYIGGFGVAKGYYNMPEKTRDTFITINNIPYYRSGDYAIELPNGEISIKGRIDNQIKLRGLRIEIGEIEANISEYPNIKKNVVLIREINNTEHLCAYYTASEKIDKDDLKEYLKGKLTRYMVPTVFMQLDEMPQTPNGKTDTKQLPEPKIETNFVAPQTPLEQLICAVFSTTLDIETVGAEDNFFEIGGTSLIASKLIIELIKRDYSISYENIFQNQTPRELAKFLSGEADTKDLHLDLLENYDYTSINELLSENTLENFHNGEMGEIGNVLITGVTGFLGIHVLYEFLKNETGIAYCMVRKGKFDTCKDRLVDLMEYYFDEDLSDLIDLRVVLSEGDITDINDFKKLENCPIDTIVNCAAIVKHYSADDYIFRVNVDGVINGLEFAKANKMKFVQISTVSVLTYPMDETLDVDFNERSFYYGQDLTNKYVNSKFLAERKVLEYAVNGLDVKIVRVGNLMSRYYDGRFQKNYDTNAFLNNLKALVKIKAISESINNDEVEMSPINFTAKAVLALSKTPGKCRVFNCTNNNIIHNYNIIDVLNSFGYEIKKVSNPEFVEICKNNMDENIQGLITSETSIDDDESYEEYTNNEQTTAILHELKVDWPEIDKEYLKRVITYLNELNFFN